jgi:site-specific recombinase XerD
MSDQTKLPLLDSRNYPRAIATLPGHRRGMSPANKGKTYPPEVFPAEQVQVLLEACPTTLFGLRLRASIAVLYRTGMWIAELRHARMDDLDLTPGRETIRAAGTKLVSRTLALDSYAMAHLEPWLEKRRDLPGDGVLCVVEGPTAGRDWEGMQTRHELRRLGKAALQRRVNPMSLRLTLAAEMIDEQWPLSYMQTQLGLSSIESFKDVLPQLGILPADEADVAEIARFRPPRTR